uniref:Uncharacterized protein n=1 Tax=Oryza rufipogon TaxID=4529 RepID=A0A0E0N8K3_ORYRU
MSEDSTTMADLAKTLSLLHVSWRINSVLHFLFVLLQHLPVWVVARLLLLRLLLPNHLQGQ